MASGIPFVISAPSGAGKSTILARVLAQVPALAFSVSHTTRPPRPGEQDGRDYHFVSRDEFHRMREAGVFYEWAEVHGNCYGTSREAVAAQLDTGTDVLLDIDVQGAAQVRRATDQAVLVFIAPPSLAELERRLRGRGTDDPETIARRLANARGELAQAHLYDHLVVNDDLDEAVTMVTSVILAHRSRRRRRLDNRVIDLAGLAVPGGG